MVTLKSNLETLLKTFQLGALALIAPHDELQSPLYVGVVNKIKQEWKVGILYK